MKKHGYNCVIMAPTTIRKASGDKVKTDRKDARLLSMTLASDGYRKVYLPDPSDESTKEFTRTRNTLKGHLKKAKIIFVMLYNSMLKSMLLSLMIMEEMKVLVSLLKLY